MFQRKRKKGEEREGKTAMMRDGEPAQKNMATRLLTQYAFSGKPAYL